MSNPNAWPLKQPSDEVQKIANSLNVCKNCLSEVPNDVDCYIDVKHNILYCPKCAVKLGKWPKEAI